MADSSDVERALVSLIGAIVYPTGQTGSPPLSIVGAPIRIERGWPDQAKLDADLRNNIVNITIYPRPNMERNLTRYPSLSRENALPAPTYTLTSVGQAITVGGAAPTAYAPQNLAIFVGGEPFVVTATAGQTPAQLAAALQALMQGAVPGITVAGALITLPNGARLTALRVGITGSTTREVRRQEKHYQVCFWCPNPDVRDAAVSAVDAALSDTPFFALADGSQARLRYTGSVSSDAPQKELLYRRDLFYCVEFATTITTPATQIVAAEAIVADIELVDRTGDVVFGLDFSIPGNDIQPGL